MASFSIGSKAVETDGGMWRWGNKSPPYVLVDVMDESIGDHSRELWLRLGSVACICPYATKVVMSTYSACLWTRCRVGGGSRCSSNFHA